jgi:colanic acid biosynthesis glycosyl transferase WcaI
MKVLIITYVYPPEHAPAGMNAEELAEQLTCAGHRVQVLTGFPSHPSGRLFPGWKARWVSRETTTGGFELIRCLHSFVPRYGLAGKLWYYFTFALSSFGTGLFQSHFDVLVTQSTPLFGGITAVLLAKLKRARIFYWVHDVHPESGINAGLLNPGILSAIMKAIDTWICRRCDIVGTLTDDMRGLLLARGLPADRVVIQRHWVDEDRIRPLPRDNGWRSQQAIAPDRFVALHAGTIGYISGAAVLIEAARILKDRRKILFLFVGDGPLKADLQERATEYGLTSVRFLPFQPEEDLSSMQATGDVGLVTLKPLSGTSSIPSKMHGYTSAARPVIASVDPASATARLITEGQFGWVVPPDDAPALARAILHAATNPDECWRRGAKAREFFIREFGRQAIISGYCQKLETLYRQGTGAPARAGGESR